jgi:hypothetical protein
MSYVFADVTFIYRDTDVTKPVVTQNNEYSSYMSVKSSKERNNFGNIFITSEMKCNL